MDDMEAPFTVIIDTAEQLPFSFSNITRRLKGQEVKIIVPVRRLSLPTGDYSIEGMQPGAAERCVAVERKSIQDFLNCCGNDRDRFEQQVFRLNTLERGYVVVEGDWHTINTEDHHSRISRKTVLATVIAWQNRYRNVHWWFCAGRNHAEQATFWILDRFFRDLEREHGQ